MTSEQLTQTQLFKAMKSSGNYGSDQDILETIHDMRASVAAGEDPTAILHEEGFEPDYVLDLL